VVGAAAVLLRRVGGGERVERILGDVVGDLTEGLAGGLVFDRERGAASRRATRRRSTAAGTSSTIAGSADASSVEDMVTPRRLTV
jgi:hypothetical protein